MASKKRTILQPEYLSRFNCIGSKCEDSCCIGWKVSIDKKTFLKYRRVQDSALTPLLDKCIKRERSPKVKSDEAYAKIVMNGEKCPFLNVRKLCTIQSKLSHDDLCDTCATYPRLYKLADKKLERCATVSCPEIARLALSNPNGIAFETIEIDPNAVRIPPRAPSIDSRLAKFADKSTKYFWEVRMFCLTMLQNRDYSIGQRLIILGILCQKIDELDKAKCADGIPALLEKFDAEIESGALKKNLSAVENNFQIQLRLAKELTDNRLKMALIASRNYLDCIKKTLVGLECFADTPTNDILKKYVENRKVYVLPYLKEKEYVLENFIVNEFFTRFMPFGSGSTCWESYLHLCVLYGMIKLHMNGMGGYNKKLTDEIVLETIQAFSKVVIHNTQFISNMVKLLKDSGFDTLACMTILVND